MATKPTATITLPNGRKRVVFVQNDAEQDGSLWATASALNSDQGYMLRPDGTAEQRRYKNGEAIAIRAAGSWKHDRIQGMIVNGTSSLVSVGVEALEALGEMLKAHEDEDDPLELAEFFVFENAPVRAILCDDAGSHEYLWTGNSWAEDIR